jgi:uncharacterized protein with NRDE domain
MCTLIVGHHLLGPGSLVAGANRDEDPGRPSAPPRLLIESPRTAGGLDLRAGGTWLAVRGTGAAIAVLNRWGGAPPADVPARRSRGQLPLDVARTLTDDVAPERWADLALATARRAIAAAAYAPFSLVFLSAARAWVLRHQPDAEPRVTEITPGWHVLTHTELDDAKEPRTAMLVEMLATFSPRDLDDAEAKILELLRLHAGDRSAGSPAVCMHEGRMVTVSSALLRFTERGLRYRHVEGRPCTAAPQDFTSLLTSGLAAGRTS